MVKTADGYKAIARIRVGDRVFAKDEASGKTGYKPATAQYGNPYQKAVIDLNRIQNNGQVKCANCGIETIPAKQSIKNTTPTSNERQVDHVIPKSKGGQGTPKNGQVLCRGCNIKKSNK